MASINMDLVKELRKKTQVGMMDCKKALIESDGNIEKAIELLRKKGAAVAAKRAGHATDNGRIESYVSDDFKSGSLVQLACETDFSANTEDMKKFIINVAKEALTNSITNTIELLEKSSSIKNQYDELLAKISERIEIDKITNFTVEEHGIVNTYIHPGSTVGVMVELAAENDASGHLEELKTVARNICMHTAVTNPICATPENLDPEILEKEQDIMKEQLKNSGKPDKIIDKIMLGKTNKYYENICLSKQKYIKDDSLSIEEYLKQIGDKISNKVTIKRFVRFSIGGK